MTGVLAVAIVAPSRADAVSPTVTSGSGGVTLDRLVGGGLPLAATYKGNGRTFRFQMPPGATQGPATWYMLKMDVTVQFERSPGNGPVLVSAAVNGQAAAKVNFYPGESRAGRPVTEWRTADLIHGATSDRQEGRRATVEFRNYLQLDGVAPGPATLSFRAETIGQDKAARVYIDESSGVYATSTGPVRLGVTGEFTREELDVGEMGQLEVTVTNTSARPAREVELSIQPASPGLFTDSAVVETIPLLRGMSKHTFAVGSSHAGDLRVKAIAADGFGNEDRTVVSLAVGDASSWGLRRWLVGAGLLLMAAAVVVSHRRKAMAAA